MDDFYVDLAKKQLPALGEYAECRVERTQVREFSMKNGVLLGAAQYVRSGAGFRFFNKGSLGFCSTDDLDKIPTVSASTEAIVKRAVAKSEAYVLSDEQSQVAKYSVQQKQPVETVSVEACVELLKDIDGSLREKAPSRYLSLELELIEKVFLNSAGSEIRSTIPRINLMYMFTGEHAQRIWQRGACTGFEVFKQWNLPTELAKEAVEIEKANSTSKRLTGKTNLVVSPEIAGIIAHESCGHPYEADRILGREAAQAGESFVKLNMLNSKFSNECVSIIDDPTVPGSYGYYLYDDEGVKAGPKKLIENGKINALLSDRSNAAAIKQKSSGNSRASAFNREPLIRMSNTFFQPGEKSEQELLSEVKNGLYLRRFMEWNIDDVRYNQKYVGCEAYVIKNGEIGEPIKNPIIEITTPQMYASIVDVANNVEYHAASCGKGEPMQGMPVFMGGPSLRIDGINLK